MCVCLCVCVVVSILRQKSLGIFGMLAKYMESTLARHFIILYYFFKLSLNS